MSAPAASLLDRVAGIADAIRADVARWTAQDLATAKAALDALRTLAVGKPTPEQWAEAMDETLIAFRAIEGAPYWSAHIDNLVEGIGRDGWADTGSGALRKLRDYTREDYLEKHGRTVEERVYAGDAYHHTVEDWTSRSLDEAQDAADEAAKDWCVQAVADFRAADEKEAA